jgi:hypothetical protein
VDGAVQDAGLAIRMLTRDRGFAVTATLVLGLGIGVTHMFLTIVYAHTWRGLPVPRPDRLLYVSVVDDRGVDRSLSRREFEELRASARTVTSVVAFTSAPVTVGDEGRAPDRFDASYIGPDAFAPSAPGPSPGRDLVAEDHRQSAAPVVLLGRTAWRAIRRGPRRGRAQRAHQRLGCDGGRHRLRRLGVPEHGQRLAAALSGTRVRHAASGRPKSPRLRACG